MPTRLSAVPAEPASRAAQVLWRGRGAPVIIVGRLSKVRLGAEVHLEEGQDGNGDDEGQFRFPG